MMLAASVFNLTLLSFTYSLQCAIIIDLYLVHSSKFLKLLAVKTTFQGSLLAFDIHFNSKLEVSFFCTLFIWKSISYSSTNKHKK